MCQKTFIKNGVKADKVSDLTDMAIGDKMKRINVVKQSVFPTEKEKIPLYKILCKKGRRNFECDCCSR